MHRRDGHTICMQAASPIPHTESGMIYFSGLYFYLFIVEVVLKSTVVDLFLKSDEVKFIMCNKHRSKVSKVDLYSAYLQQPSLKTAQLCHVLYKGSQQFLTATKHVSHLPLIRTLKNT